MALTRTQILLLQQMCLDGEVRCHQRIAQAASVKDHEGVAYFSAIRDRYIDLKKDIAGQYEAHDTKLILSQIYRLLDEELARSE